MNKIELQNIIDKIPQEDKSTRYFFADFPQMKKWKKTFGEWVIDTTKNNTSTNFDKGFVENPHNQTQMQQFIKDMMLFINQHPMLKSKSQITKDFIMLSFLPRPSYNTNVMSLFVQEYLKHINAQAPDKRWNLHLSYPTNIQNNKPDGSIFVTISTPKKTNKSSVMLNAHMDVIIDKNHNTATDDFVINEWDTGILGAKTLLKDNEEYGTDKTTLGADDGKGICMIFDTLRHQQNSINTTAVPSISCFFCAKEEPTINKIPTSSRWVNLEQIVVSNQIFPDVIVNLDSYCGMEIDTYNKFSEPMQKHLDESITKSIIQAHEQAMKSAGVVSKQAEAWNNPPSDGLLLRDRWFEKNAPQVVENETPKTPKQQIKDLKTRYCPTVISMAIHSEAPHSNKESINLKDFDWKQEFLNNKFLNSVHNYITKAHKEHMDWLKLNDKVPQNSQQEK